MKLTVTAHPDRVSDLLNRKRRDALGLTTRAVQGIVQTGTQIGQAIAPTGPTGNYRRKFGGRVAVNGERVEGQIGDDAPHAHLVERGRKPGRMPPPAKIAAIFDLPLADGFKVARAIARTGTRGVHVLERTHSLLRPAVRRIAKRLLEELGRL